MPVTKDTGRQHRSLFLVQPGLMDDGSNEDVKQAEKTTTCRHRLAHSFSDREVRPMLHQVGGHFCADPNETPYMLRMEPSYILKVVQPGQKGEREVQLYDRVFSAEAEMNALRGDPTFLQSFVPRYYGTTEVRGVRYVVLEDLCLPAGPSPWILDMKMGRVISAVDAPPEKVKKELAKYPHQETVGFRITGMKVYDDAKGVYITFDKTYGRSLAPESVVEALASFFVPGSSEADLGRLVWFMDRLELLLQWFKAQHSLVFRSSSLLFVHAGPGSSVEGADVRMIDFANTTSVMATPEAPSGGSGGRGGCMDESYVYGLSSLLAMLRDIHRRETTTK